MPFTPDISISISEKICQFCQEDVPIWKSSANTFGGTSKLSKFCRHHRPHQFSTSSQQIEGSKHAKSSSSSCISYILFYTAALCHYSSRNPTWRGRSTTATPIYHNFELAWRGWGNYPGSITSSSSLVEGSTSLRLVSNGFGWSYIRRTRI